MPDGAPLDFVLGLDLGSNSLGWAMIRLLDGEPAGLIRAGVRVFEAGMDDTKGLGNEESRNKARRDARSHRRQLWRHRRRLVKLAHILQRYGLLPQGNVIEPEPRQDFLNRLDAEILASDWFAGKEKSGAFPEPRHTLPYILRASALDEKLEPHPLGRALYHLAQRRGFLSNRKAAPKKGDDEGAVKEGIAELRSAVSEAGARSLGEYFSRLKPSQDRIRSRWTARDMYEEEFKEIWEAQSKHHPSLLTEANRKAVHRAIFHQRPLWFNPNTIGHCELEPAERRAPAYHLLSQRFRLLQTVNNLRILPPDDVEMPLTPADRQKLVDELETKGDRTFKQTSKLLKLEPGYEFNLQRGGEKSIKGNRTNAGFCSVFGDRWLQMTAEERERAVEYVHAFHRADKLKDAAKRRFQLGDGAAEKLAEISLEPDYMNLSRKAMEKLIPLLERGFPYGTLAPRYSALSAETTEKLLGLASAGAPFKDACKSILGDPGAPSDEHELLPAVASSLTEIRNPAVMRSLTELRKVVNAVVRQHGKPVQIRIELARNLKQSRKQRVAASDSNRRNEKARADAAEKIIKGEVGIKEPKPIDKRKYLLAEECHWTCPYTGKSISMRSLFGPEAQFDIEHIIPFSVSMDNSFQNLTLCYIPENRTVKGNRTPHQAYSGDPARYEAILDRVKRFGGDRRTVAAKLRRFRVDDDELELFLEDFRNRQLNDTAYASRLAKEYLGLLYGGEIDKENRRRVFARSGRATSDFRALWKLNSILDDGPTTNGGLEEKKRADHRHHAVDAVVIGLASDAMIQRLSRAAQAAESREGRRRLFGPLEGPWPNFTDSVRAEIEKIVVSHRVSKKVSGALHEETIYSAPKADGSLRVRKPLAALTKNEVEDIADEGVKTLVLAKLNGGEPKKIFANEENLPAFETSDGRRIPIKRARINKALKPFTLGQGRTIRHVASDSNHHVEIYAEIDKDGNEGKWDGEVVSMYEAYQRVKAHKTVVRRDYGPLGRFKFSLAPGEVIECDDGKGGRALWVSRGVASYESGPRLLLVRLNDARQKKEMLKTGSFWTPFVNPLRKLNPRKVVVSPIGEVIETHEGQDSGFVRKAGAS